MFPTASLPAFEGASVTFLAKPHFTHSGSYPTVDQVKGNAHPAFEGDPAGFLDSNAQKCSSLQRFLTNKIKKCPHCGKPNAFTLATCNACGTSIGSTPVTHSNNVFMGFVFGIQRAPFPLTISIRLQDAEFLVMDDLLALAPLHFNVISTSRYIPDWRYLLRRPAEALDLVSEMITRCEEATKPFLDSAEWCARLMRNRADFNVATDMACGFNYPPSQYQLHIQYMMPNLLPFQFAQFLKGVHFTPRRFFPVSYVKECLAMAAKAPLPAELLQETTPVVAIIEHFAALGIDYDKVHASFLSNFRTLAARFSAWDPRDFEVSVVEAAGTSHVLPHNQQAASSSNEGPIHDIIAADKLFLQNYGRPYTAEGRPTGSFYGFPKQPSEIQEW